MSVENTRALIQQAQTLLTQALTELPAPVVPPFYTATTDRNVKQKPAPLPLGPAPFAFKDPVFGTSMLRVTDEKTDNGLSLRVPSNAHLSAWSCDGSKFLVINEGGGVVVFASANGTVSRLPVETRGYSEPAFSYLDPNLIICCGGSNHRTVFGYDVVKKTPTVWLDLDVKYPQLGLAGKGESYMGGLLATDNDVWAALFGGASQDQHTYIHHSKAGLFDSGPLGWKIHSFSLDRPGRYVFIYPAQAYAAQFGNVVIWDTQTGALTKLVVGADVCGGHDSLGYGVAINQDSSPRVRYDGLQWQYRDIASPHTTRDLIVPPLSPQETYVQDHSCWRHCKPDNKQPLVSFVYRRHVQGVPDAPWRAWDDEIIAVAVDGSGVVNRFCHHQSLWDRVNADGTVSGDFWAQPIGNVSPDGHSAIVTSNWGRTLGLSGTMPRQDVFLVSLV